MVSRKGQAAFEYIMIFGLAMLVVLLASYATFSYIDSYRRATSVAQLQALGQSLANNAETIYYFGAPSQLVLDVQMPGGVESMTVRTEDRSQGCTKCTEILFNTTDGREVYVALESPIRIEGFYDPSRRESVVRWDQGRGDGSCSSGEGCSYITPGLKRWRILANGTRQDIDEYHVALRMVTQ